MKIKNPLKLKFIMDSYSIVSSLAPVISENISIKIQEREEKKRLEQIYNNQKHNGFVKYASIVLSLVTLFVSILLFKHSKIISGLIGLLGLISYIITFLYCNDFIKEKKHNVYKLVFMIGNLLLVLTATFLLF